MNDEAIRVPTREEAQDIRLRRWARIRQNIESAMPVLCYAPPGEPPQALEFARRIEERGFERTMYEDEDRYSGLLLWASEPDGTSVQCEVLLEVSLDCCVKQYEQLEAPGHGVTALPDGRWGCGCGLTFLTQDAARQHLQNVPYNEYDGTGRLFVPMEVVNAHTISRRVIIPDFEALGTP